MNSLFSNTLIYGIGFLLSRLQTFLLLPFLTRYLGTSDFGLLETINAAGIFLTMLSVFNIDSGFLAYFHDQKTESDKKILTQGSIGLSLMISALVLLISIMFPNSISEIITSQANIGPLFIIAAIASVIAGQIHLQLVIVRTLERPWHYTWTVLLQTFFYFTLALIFLQSSENKVYSVLMAQLIGNLLALGFVLSINRKFLTFNFAPIHLWQSRLFKVALPLFPFSIAGWGLNLFDRGFMAHSRGLVDTGIYGLAIKVSQMASLLFAPFQMAWLPRSLQSLKDKTEDKVFPMTAKGFLFVSGVAVIGLTGFANLIIALMAPNEYFSAGNWVGTLVFCNLLLVLYTFSSSRFLYQKKSIYSTYAFAIGAFANITINLILTPAYGIRGAVIGNVFGYSLMFLSAQYFAHQIHPINFSFVKKIILLLSLLFISLLPHTIDLSGIISQMAFTLISGLGFILLYLLLFGRPQWK